MSTAVFYVMITVEDDILEKVFRQLVELVFVLDLYELSPPSTTWLLPSSSRQRLVFGQLSQKRGLSLDR